MDSSGGPPWLSHSSWLFDTLLVLLMYMYLCHGQTELMAWFSISDIWFLMHSQPWWLYQGDYWWERSLYIYLKLEFIVNPRWKVRKQKQEGQLLCQLTFNTQYLNPSSCVWTHPWPPPLLPQKDQSYEAGISRKVQQRLSMSTLSEKAPMVSVFLYFFIYFL